MKKLVPAIFILLTITNIAFAQDTTYQAPNFPKPMLGHFKIDVKAEDMKRGKGEIISSRKRIYEKYKNNTITLADARELAGLRVSEAVTTGTKAVNDKDFAIVASVHTKYPDKFEAYFLPTMLVDQSPKRLAEVNSIINIGIKKLKNKDVVNLYYLKLILQGTDKDIPVKELEKTNTLYRLASEKAGVAISPVNQLAVICQNRGEIKEAEKYYTSSLNEASGKRDKVLCLTARQGFYTATGNISGALADCKKIILMNEEAQNPLQENYIEALASIVTLYDVKDSYDDALNYMNQLIKSNENKKGTQDHQLLDYSLRSGLETGLGMYDMAKNDLDQEEKILKQSKRALSTDNLKWFYYFNAKYFMAKNNYGAAVANIDKGLSYNERDLELHLLKGDTLLAQKKFPEAIKEYDMLVKYYPAWFNGYYKRGIAYESMGEKDRSKKDFQKAVALSGGYFLPAKR